MDPSWEPSPLSVWQPVVKATVPVSIPAIAAVMITVLAVFVILVPSRFMVYEHVVEEKKRSGKLIELIFNRGKISFLLPKNQPDRKMRENLIQNHRAINQEVCPFHVALDFRETNLEFFSSNGRW